MEIPARTVRYAYEIEVLTIPHDTLRGNKTASECKRRTGCCDEISCK